MQDRGGSRRRMLRGAAVIAAIMFVSGCTPPAPGPDDWALEPISFQNSFVGSGPEATPAGPPTDLTYGMHVLSSDGAGGFWTASSGSWLHVGADGETLARFDTEPSGPLSKIRAMAPLSPTELVVVQGDRAHVMPMLSVFDTTTMTLRDLPGDAVGDEGDLDFGDFEFGDVAVHDGDAIVVRYQPRPPDDYLDFEVLRVDLDSGARTLLHSGPVELDDAPGARPGVPPIGIDVDDAGRMYLATPTARIVLTADGTELSREPQVADHPLVAAAPDGTALWWGGEPEQSDAQGVIVGGSSEARQAIEPRMHCAETSSSDIPRRGDALRLSDSAGQHPLPFLCGANAAAWTDGSWVVATGGEGDGVLVRVTPPTGS
ncbi:hypothetical protein HCX50_01075 [Microbacterium oxydans]|uniref:hypothetical protein n=1 Tax=Microbacterium sp. B19(2022) TaxID=2914045 RepID=UPI0014313FE5|nr:hypothetical protein [Microbacterium sp. B19(2022)]NJI58015.1 hypothetical protein [Microbacterium sp. B19(2022)]